MKSLDQDFLYSQLIKLGDMMGDGLHLEPDGKWISKEYRKVTKALGLNTPVKRRPRTAEQITEIDTRMAQRVIECECPLCKKASLKQIRSGSMKAKCTICSRGYTLLKRGKGKANG